MATIIENTATLLESFEVGFRNAHKEPYFILDSDSENIISAEVACALIRNPVVKLQLRMVATKEVPPLGYSIRLLTSRKQRKRLCRCTRESVK